MNDVEILELSIESLSKEFDELISRCMDSEGKPKQPDSKALIRAKACLPSYCDNAFKRKTLIKERIIRDEDAHDTTRKELWPVPDEIKGFSARDVFLWYICDGWQKIFSGNEEIKTEVDHDLGFHVLRRGDWRFELRDLGRFPLESD